MYLQYGTYQHASDETVIVRARKVEHDDSGRAIKERQQWNISGRLQAADPSAITTAVGLLEAAYAVDGRDIALYQDNGTITAVKMLTASTMNGVRVTSRPELDLSGAQYSTYLDYRISVEGDIAILPTTSGRSLIASQETLEIQGDGGPAFVVREPLVGMPVPFQTKQRTKTTATQTGYAEGYGNYPFAGQPFSPQWLKRDISRVKYVPPARNFTGSKTQQVFRIEWTYFFESPGPNSGGSF